MTDAAPLRVVQVGAGGMGRQWIRTITANPDVELVGLVDLNTDAAHAALADAGLAGVAVGTSVSDVAAQTGAHAVINVTVPVAHHPVNVEALFAGLPVLCEKPAAPTVAQALSLAASASVSGELLMISQSRRYYPELAELRAQATARPLRSSAQPRCKAERFTAPLLRRSTMREDHERSYPPM